MTLMDYNGAINQFADDRVCETMRPLYWRLNIIRDAILFNNLVAGILLL